MTPAPKKKRVFSTAAMTAPTAEDSIAGAPAAAAAATAEPVPVVEPAPARETAAAAPAPVAGGKPIRVTVQVEFDEHRELRRLCDRYADEIGVAQVAGAEVFRALLQLAREDDVVARKLGKMLAKTGGTRRRN